ncbi:hypothetical protein ACFL3T_01750 [Patescibacteria group bacterium]
MDDQIIELLEKNNELLSKLVKFQQKEQRAQTRRWIFQISLQLLPFILLFILGWWVFAVVNENIALVQANVDAIKESMSGIWDNVTFWD